MAFLNNLRLAVKLPLVLGALVLAALAVQFVIDGVQAQLG